MKKIEEGICPITGKETTFKSLKDGYLKYAGRGICSKDNKIKHKKEATYIDRYGSSTLGNINRSKRIENYKRTRTNEFKLNYYRSKLLRLLKVINIDPNNNYQCQICGDDLSELNRPFSHMKVHGISVKEYYDRYFKRDDEGICPITGNETEFESGLVGYRTYSKGAYTRNETLIENNKQRMILKLRNNISEKQSKYNVEFVNIDDINKATQLTKIKCSYCNLIYINRWYNVNSGYGKCPNCFPKNKGGKSQIELELSEFLSSVTELEYYSNYMGLITNPKTGSPLELDFYFPDNNLAIEIDGLYWHSDSVQDDPKNIHLIKTNLCKDIDIQLIHIFEDEWYEKSDILKSIIKHKLKINKELNKIYARNCIIREIDTIDKSEFLKLNHIQGNDYSNIKLGAYFNDKLVSVMTFSYGNISRGGRPDNKRVFELSRFCSDMNYRVIGIAGKLFKYFIRNYDAESIYSYADLRYSNGNLYDKLGFELLHRTRPDYWYVDGTRRIYRFNLRKSKLDDLTKTESSIRKEEKYKRVYDCGKLKYAYFIR